MKSRGLYDNDAYVREEINYINTLQDIFEADDEPISSNQCVPFDYFMRDLVEHEEEKSGYPIDKVRFGRTFLFMIDKLYDHETLVEICKKISKKFRDLPYYAKLRKIGKGYYIVMFVSERYYFNGELKEFYIEYNSDRYYNPETGQICKKDAPNAAILYRKGDLSKKKYYAKFSKKEELFRYANSKEFEFKMEELKLFFVELLKTLADAEIFDDLTIHKFNVKRHNDKYSRAKTAYWNRAIRKVEEVLARGFNDLKLMGLYEEKYINTLCNLRNQYAEMVINKEFNYKRFKLSMSPFLSFAHVRDNIEAFLSKFMETYNKTMHQIVLNA